MKLLTNKKYNYLHKTIRRLILEKAAIDMELTDLENKFDKLTEISLKFADDIIYQATIEDQEILLNIKHQFQTKL